MSETRDARVKLWGSEIGAISWDEQRAIGVFQYTPAFTRAAIQPSPLVMPATELPYAFPANRARDGEDSAFHGLPGLLSDSLPDRFGNALIDRWLASQNRLPATMNPVERLCYVGKRGMGALEYAPAERRRSRRAWDVDIARLVGLANAIVQEREQLQGQLDETPQGLEEILRVGTSAGGARAKAVLAWNPQTGAFKSGQLDAPPGYEHWLLKFDGVHEATDREVGGSSGYGRIEYAYAQMAQACGIDMSPCRLHEEGGRAHFMTARFDRAGNEKRHMQTLCALGHFDFNRPGAYSYEQAIQLCRTLELPAHDQEQLVLRAMFNVLARNQDDHTKNIAFLMDRSGRWRLAPAYDMTWSYNPAGTWTREHQMSVNDKTRGFETEDLVQLAARAGIKARRAHRLLAAVSEPVSQWIMFSARAGVPEAHQAHIAKTHRSHLFV